MQLFNKRLYPNVEPYRATGRTTAAILLALVQSMSQPDEKVPVLDHDRSDAKHTFRHTLDIVEALRFVSVQVSLVDGVVYITNKHNICA